MLLNDFMFNVSLSLNGGDIPEDDPLVLNEKEDQHDPFEFPINDKSNDFFFHIVLMLTFGND
jgi:hypothetical protein